MARRRNRESRIFFPWEKRRSRLAWLSRRHARAGAAALLVVAFAAVLVQVEARRRAVHATRAAITSVRHAVEAFRADHDGRCPASTAELLNPGDGNEPYMARLPSDGWGRPLRMTCPGRKHPDAADVVSGGPSGTFEDIDQIE